MKPFFTVAALFALSMSDVSAADMSAQCPRLFSELELCRDCLVDDKISDILFIGNSITNHSAHKPYGWTGNWGMAASRQENDWVHLVAHYISEDQGQKVNINVLNGQLSHISKEWDKVSDEILNGHNRAIFIQLGDNAVDTTFENFEGYYRQLLDLIKDHTSASIFLLTTWRHSEEQATATQVIKALAKEYNAAFIDITPVYLDPHNRSESEALCQNPAVSRFVCWHPGDAGMKGIAFEVCNQGHAAKYDSVNNELILEDILVGQDHYSAKLKNEGNFSFSLKEATLLGTKAVGSYSSVYDMDTQKLDISNVYGAHKYYQATLKKGQSISSGFTLESITPSPY